MNHKRIDALTGARFTAILIIVFSHLEFFANYSYGDTYYNYFHNPTQGVDFFFMLSGFGIMLSSVNKIEPNKTQLTDLIRFAINRIKKIYPLYIMSLLMGGVYDVLILTTQYGLSFFNALIRSFAKFLLCIPLIQSALGIQNYSHALNGVCWFLSSLFCIYLVCPLVIKFLKKFITSIQKAFIAICITIFLSYAFALFFTYVESKTMFNMLTYASPYRRIFYVICGMLIAQIYNLTKHITFHSIIEYITFTFAMFWFFVYSTFLNYLGSICYIIDMIIVASVIYVLAQGKGKISLCFASKPMVFLGNLSMYIFLTHYLIRMFVDYFVNYFNLKYTFTPFIETAVILGLTFLISILINNLYNKNSTKSYAKNS